MSNLLKKTMKTFNYLKKLRLVKLFDSIKEQKKSPILKIEDLVYFKLRVIF